MRGWGGKIVVALMVAGLVAGCSRGERPAPKLLNLEASQAGPDEFSILPNKPLQEPENFAALPAPTPGGSNRVAATPNDDAIAALGGNPAAVARSIPASDGGLVSHVGRFGGSTGIRETLAQEDLEFRRRKNGRVLERVFNVNVYYKAYQKQSLDQYSELARFRRLGVRTPSPPPAPTEN